MKRFLAVGLAGAIAMTAFTAFPNAASAHGWYGGPYYTYAWGYPPPPPPTYYYYPCCYYQYDPGPALVAGIFGTFLGAVISSQHHHVHKKKY